MGLKIWLINGILAVVAAFFVMRALEVWGDGPKTALRIHALDRSDAKPRAMTPKKIIARPILPESAYESVVSKNLFSPDREASSTGDSAQEDGDDWANSVHGKHLVGLLKQIILHGVVITEEFRGALVTTPAAVQATPSLSQSGGSMPSFRGRAPANRNDPAAATAIGSRAAGLAGGEKGKTEWVRVGDSLNVFTVANILPDRVLLKSDSRELELLMYDKDKPKRRDLPKKPVADKDVKSEPAKEASKTVTKESRDDQKEAQSLILKRSQEFEALRKKALQGLEKKNEAAKNK